MPNNDITKLLKLEGLNFETYEEKEEYIILNFSRKDERPNCPRCGSTKLHINDYRIHKATDLPINNKPVKLHILKQRYICAECKKTITGSLKNVLPRKQHTEKVILFIKEKLKKLTYKDCSKELNISSTTTMRLFKNSTNYKEQSEFPKVIHIDEFKGNSSKEKYQLAIVNGETGKIFDVLINRKQRDLKEYLQIPKGKPEIVVIDMWEPYYNAVKSLWPEVTVIADRFHYVRQINWCVRDVRLRIQKTHLEGNKLKKYWKLFMKNSSKLSFLQNEKLEELLSLNEELRIVYGIKKGFESVISKKSKAAQEEFDKWLDGLRLIKIQEAEKLFKTFENWYPEITASFYYDYNNGIAEGINNKIKVIKRQAYGIRNFDNLRRLIMHRIS